MVLMSLLLFGCASIESYKRMDNSGNEIQGIRARGLGNVEGKIGDRSIKYKPLPIPENLPLRLE